MGIIPDWMSSIQRWIVVFSKEVINFLNKFTVPWYIFNHVNKPRKLKNVHNLKQSQKTYNTTPKKKKGQMMKYVLVFFVKYY